MTTVIQNNWKKKFALLTATTIITSTAFIGTVTAAGIPAEVQKQLDAQSAKIQSLETKMDKLIEILTPMVTKTAAAAAPTTKAAAPAKIVASKPVPQAALPKVKAGTWLDVYLLPNSDGWNLKTRPKERSAGRLTLNESVFKKSIIKKDKLLKSLGETNGKDIAFAWSGVFVAKEVGDYDFAVELLNNSSYNRNCIATLSVDGIDVATTGSKSNGRTQEKGSITLEKGVYDFNVWQSCGLTSAGNNHWLWKAYESLQVSLYMRGPKDNGIALVPTSLLGHLD